MFRSTTLTALALAALGGEDHLARRALERVDPIVAAWCRPRVARAITRASSLVADRTDRPHVLRLAYLAEAGALRDLDYEDRASVRAAFDAIAGAAAPIRNGWRLSALAVALVLSTATLAVVRPWNAKAWDPRSTSLGRALGEDLARYVASVSHASPRRGASDAEPARVDSASRERVLSAVASEIGVPGGDAARTFFVAYEAAALSPSYDRGLNDAMFAALQRTNAVVRDSHRPYWFDVIGDGATGPLIVSYYVARAQTVSVEGAAIPLLRVQRLDSLNRSLAALGYTSPRVGAAVVTLDKLEEEAVSLLLPALGDGATAHMVDAPTETAPPEWLPPYEKRVGELLRAEVPEARRSALAEVATLLTRRSQTLATLRLAATWSGGSISSPRRLVDEERFEALDGRVARGVLAEWRDVNVALGDARLRDAADAFVGDLATIVDRHEVQHQIDFRAGIVPVPTVLERTLGTREEGEDGSLAPSALEARARDELSAELAAIAQAHDLARTALVLATTPLFDKDDWGTPYPFVAAAILTALAIEVGGGEDLYAERGAFDRARAASAFLAVTAKSGAEIAVFAGRAYARLFGRELPAVSAGTWLISKRWSR